MCVKKVDIWELVIQALPGNPYDRKSYPFFMVVEDVFDIHRDDFDKVLTGIIQTGEVHKGDTIFIGDVPYEVCGIEMFRKIWERAEEGDNVGLLVKPLDADDDNEELSKNDSVCVIPDSPKDLRINWTSLLEDIKRQYGCTLEKGDFHKNVNVNPALLVDSISHIIDSESGHTTSNASKSQFKPQLQMNIDKNKLEYVVGIDLGHGETSAALCPIQWETPTEQLDAVKDLDMGGNKKVIPSAITILEDGNAYIGDKAFRPDFLKKATVKVCFKKAPKDINGEDEKLMIRFMKEVYQTIRENNPAILLDGNHLVYIATPSGWDKKTMNLYAEMARIAGIPLGGVTKESRAAFVRAQQDQTSGLGRNITKGAIVFDMGSSTLDFTYLNLSKGDGLIDHGYNCGASFIEKFIFKKAEERSEVIRSFEEKYPKLTSRLVFEARVVKEQVYFDPTAKVKKFVNFEELIDDDDDFEDERFKIQFEPGELNAQLEEAGYLKFIEDSMQDYIDIHIKSAPIYGVFLTGGASRMDFIKPLIMKVWGVPEEKIFRDQDPSLTISQGVAEVARMDLRTDGVDTKVGEMIEALKEDNNIYDNFVNSFGEALFVNVIEGVSDVFCDFRDSAQDSSINQLQSRVERKVNACIQEVTPQAIEKLNEAIQTETEDIRRAVESAVFAYTKLNGVQPPSMPSLDISDPKIVKGLSLKDVINDVSTSIANNSNVWTDIITTSAIGFGLGMLLGGPLAWLILGGGYLASKIWGDSEEEKKRKAMQKKLDKSSREQVVQAISEKWEGEITPSIANSIQQSLNENKEIKKSINKAINLLLSSYENSLKEARILID